MVLRLTLFNVYDSLCIWIECRTASEAPIYVHIFFSRVRRQVHTEMLECSIWQIVFSQQSFVDASNLLSACWVAWVDLQEKLHALPKSTSQKILICGSKLQNKLSFSIYKFDKSNIVRGRLDQII